MYRAMLTGEVRGERPPDLTAARELY